MSETYELQENGRVTGPHSLVVLRQKAEIRVLHPDSTVRLVGPGPRVDSAPWLAIRAIPELHADLFPQRVTPKLATTQTGFETANSPLNSGDSPAFSTDVFSILRSNAAVSRAAEDELLKDLGPRPNKRLRDYLICAIALNLFVICMGQFVGYGNPFLIGLAVMGNVGLAWVLFGVMDRY